MADPSNIDDAIEQAALNPKKVQVGNQSVEEQSLADLLAVKRQLAANAATNRPGFGVRVQKIKPRYE